MIYTEGRPFGGLLHLACQTSIPQLANVHDADGRLPASVPGSRFLRAAEALSQEELQTRAG